MAWLTSSACVQMIACGPSGITTCRAPFLSPRTVASHLYRSYPKLGIAGRHQLRDLLDEAADRHGAPSPRS